MTEWLLILALAWPTFHGAPDLRGLADADLPDKPTLQWRYLGGDSVMATPVSDGERIFFSTQRGIVTALDLNGELLWSRSMTRTNDAGRISTIRLEAPLAVCNGRVLAATRRGQLYALDAVTGETVWQYDADGIFMASPTFIGNTTAVILDQASGALHAIDLQTGEPRWVSEGVERCDGAPGVGPGHVVFGSCLAALHVYDLNGAHLRDIEVGGDGQIAGGVAVDGTLAFAGTRDGRLVCVDLASGEFIWTSEVSDSEAFATPAVSADLVVHAADDGSVYAVENKDGRVRWKIEIGEWPTSPIIVGKRVAVSADGTLYLLNLMDGKTEWTNDVSDDITSPALIAGMLVVGADDGSVSAFGGKEQQ